MHACIYRLHRPEALCIASLWFFIGRTYHYYDSSSIDIIKRTGEMVVYFVLL